MSTPPLNSMPWDAVGRFIGQIGVPAAIAFFVLSQLIPRIDHGIAVADHVDAELQFLAARGCGPPPILSHLPF